jgi:selenocysteine lyase/cysteine desulfurase
VDFTRRQFLTTGGALAAAAVATIAPSRLVAALEQQAPPEPRITQWSDVRNLFALTPGYLHFASFYIASHPRPVRDAIEQYRRTIDANPFLTLERNLFESPEANLTLRTCREVGQYLGGSGDEVAITFNTTSGLALVYHGLPLQKGDEVLTTTHDHYSHHEAIRFATSRAGATWRHIPLFERSEDATTAGIVSRVREGIRPNTRFLGVTWVHSSTGVRLPIRAIADVLADVNRKRNEADHVRLIVDGVHGLGAVDETVAGLGCDYFCAGTHKWIWAPRGTGIIWAPKKNWERLRPLIPSFTSLEAFGAWMNGTPPPPMSAALMTPGGFHAYEHQWAMSAAFQLHQRIGRARIAERIRTLNDQCKEGLATIPRVKVHTPRDHALSAGLVAFEVEGQEPDKVVAKLLERKIVASTSPYKVSYARLAPSLVNTPGEVETALRAVRDIAGAA